MTNGHWAKQRVKEEQAALLYALGRTQEADYLLGKHLRPGYIYVKDRVTEPEPAPAVVEIAQTTSWYWVKYPSGKIEYMKISEDLKDKWLGQGYVISRSKIEGVSKEPELIPIPAVHVPELIPDIHLSSNVIQIIADLESGKLLYPDWFNNNINWVKDGHIDEKTFLTAYNYEVEHGRIHPPTEPTPEQKRLYWIIKPDNRYGKRISITESGKRQYEDQGWIFSLTEPEPIEPEPIEPEPIEPEPILLSANIKISFTNLNIGGFSSSIPIDDIGKLQILSNTAPEWKYTLIGSSTNPPLTTLNELIITINDLLPNITITDNMVTQQVINFNIVDGRAIGSIRFVATNNFNPFYYGKNIVNIIQFKDPNGAKILDVVKENRLNFTETERDEVITYDEDMKGNTRATVESFVWSSATQPTAFSKMGSWNISEKEPPKPLTTGFMGAGVAGAIAGLILIGFIADHKRGK